MRELFRRVWAWLHNVGSMVSVWFWFSGAVTTILASVMVWVEQHIFPLVITTILALHWVLVYIRWRRLRRKQWLDDRAFRRVINDEELCARVEAAVFLRELRSEMGLDRLESTGQGSP